MAFGPIIGVAMCLEQEVEDLLRRAEVEEAKQIETSDAASKTRYSLIADLYEIAFALAEQHTGEDDQNTLQIRDRWALSLRKAWRLCEAIHQNSRKVRQNRDTLGSSDLTTLKTRQRLAECYLARKVYPEAIHVY